MFGRIYRCAGKEVICLEEYTGVQVYRAVISNWRHIGPPLPCHTETNMKLVNLDAMESVNVLKDINIYSHHASILKIIFENKC